MIKLYDSEGNYVSVLEDRPGDAEDSFGWLYTQAREAEKACDFSTALCNPHGAHEILVVERGDMTPELLEFLVGHELGHITSGRFHELDAELEADRFSLCRTPGLEETAVTCLEKGKAYMLEASAQNPDLAWYYNGAVSDLDSRISAIKQN